ncbi:hypothetical protein I4F81_004429 [Pyropia yezoensis]|uniref:Uncharacterized protein n=1 Tax=Pyropia yezoensis TaxID=2788 RepID=A0ACC3BVW5_PYRYE|nr:hypothetical protein I4F81_004429 [Neopyropia yezoensis]
MTFRAVGSRLMCRSHAGQAQALTRRVPCSSVLYVGVPLTEDGGRDVQGSFLLLSVGAHTHPPPPITTATRGLPVTAAEVKAHHHIFLAAQEEDVRANLADEYGRVAASVPQTALRCARRQTAAERNPWGQGRDAALRMVARAVVAGDPYFRAPIVSDAIACVFPAVLETNFRRVANGELALETDEYYKAVESVGLAQDGDFFVLAISATINNKGVTLARFFIQRATRQVARTCYRLFFQKILKINPAWAPWNVLVQRELSVVDPSLDGVPSAAVVEKATESVRRMKRGVLVGITLDFLASLTGGLCDALEDVGFDEFSVDDHARNILFGCKAHANRVCDRAPLTVRATLRKLMECYNVEEAQRLRALVIEQEPSSDCSGVLGNPRLLQAFCPAFSNADPLQREVASSTANAEESQHERIYKLCGRRQPPMVAMTGSQFVDHRDAEELDNGRAAGTHTSMERADYSQRRREKRRRESRPRADGAAADEFADGDAGVQNAAGNCEGRVRDRERERRGGGGRARADEGVSANRHSEAPARGPQPKRRRRAVGGAPAGSAAAHLRIAELEKELQQQRNKTLEAENAALRMGSIAGSGSSAGPAATAATPAGTEAGATPPAWFVSLMMAASQAAGSTQQVGINADAGHENGGSAGV